MCISTSNLFYYKLSAIFTKSKHRGKLQTFKFIISRFIETGNTEISLIRRKGKIEVIFDSKNFESNFQYPFFRKEVANELYDGLPPNGNDGIINNELRA